MNEHNIASLWFEDFYNKNKNEHNNIPWAKLKVNMYLKQYIEENNNHKGNALVIGCGLGDDAYALNNAGYKVTAIDVSKTAIDIAKNRFNNSNINFEIQDIFDMPNKYDKYFDFVFESLTIQSLPVRFRKKMIDAIANTLAYNAKLLLIAHKKEKITDGPPWPLTKKEIDLFKNHLTELSFGEMNIYSPISKISFRVLYANIIRK